jgi:hypothetical protein
MRIPIRPYLVREEPPVKAHFGVVPEALEDGAVARDVNVGRVVDLLRRQSLSRLQDSEKHNGVSYQTAIFNFAPRKKSVDCA